MSFASPVFKTLDFTAITGKKPRFFSISKVDAFCQCNQQYYQQYIRKANVYTETIYTVLGGLCHSALEDSYESKANPETPDLTPSEALAAIWNRDLETLKLGEWLEGLLKLAEDMNDLKARCQADYVWNGDPNRKPIRNKDGSVSGWPEKTTDYKNAVNKLNLESRRASIDGAAAKANARWKNISLTEVYATTTAMMANYQHPAVIHDVKWIEFPISDPWVWAADENGDPLLDAQGQHVIVSRRDPSPKWRDPETKEMMVVKVINPVFLPNGDLFNGYIDLVGTTNQGKWLLSDHKSSKKLPSPWKVQRHNQLGGMYAWAWENLTGTYPELVGITHLRSGEFVTAKPDHEFSLQAVDRTVQIIKAIDNHAFYPIDPHGFGAGCFDYRTGEVDCAFFPLCHPAEWQERNTIVDEEELFG